MVGNEDITKNALLDQKNMMYFFIQVMLKLAYKIVSDFGYVGWPILTLQNNLTFFDWPGLT